MALSIVIPTLNEEKHLRALLDSLLAQHLETAHEVIIVDASPNDLTTEVVNQFLNLIPITVTKSSIADIGTQRNIGARLAQHDHLLFLDADVILGEGVIQRSLDRLSPDELHIISARHRADRPSFGTHTALFFIYFLILLARLAHFPVTNGDFLLTNKRTFQSLDGFREGFLLGEDTDFGIRARSLGARHSIEWRASITASSRRLSTVSAWKLAVIWAAAYMRVIRGKGPTGTRKNDEGYPYGKWSDL
ncbi:glycosyltransferase [Streptomyces pseudovenezuelae]|uniref:glycosyltransferase n=1 Tax=Streptomyces pseudovenezuelae TaxID=67350 RepID=UPI0034A21E8D